MATDGFRSLSVAIDLAHSAGADERDDVVGAEARPGARAIGPDYRGSKADHWGLLSPKRVLLRIDRQQIRLKTIPARHAQPLSLILLG
jgi:hypothetical protein